MGQRLMIKYKWQCACKIWIETDTELQMDKAMDRHYRKHLKENPDLGK